MKEPVYEVFARKNRDEPLRHIGYINALNTELARVCAWTTYDEQNWFEMCIVPRAAVVPVNLHDGPFQAGVTRREERWALDAEATGSYGGSEVVG